MDKPLIVIGASARAGAQSAVRAGFQPWSADLFADVDLPRPAELVPVEKYPHGFIETLATVPDCPWIYTGALENHPALIDRLAALRPLWGNASETLRAVRDPVRLADTLRRAGFPTPAVTVDADGVPRDGTSLRKPLRSAGGSGVTAATDGDAIEASRQTSGGCYFQRRIEGQPVSAAYVASSNGVQLLGVTAQLIGDDGGGKWWCTADWSGANGYSYSGSIGPLALPNSIAHQATKIGACVAQRFGLVGLFGIDAVLADNELWPVEVNPRYTASIEVHERATGLKAVALHAEACIGQTRTGSDGARPELIAPMQPQPNQLVVGKAILYASRDIDVPHEFPACAARANDNAAWPILADIPHGGSRIAMGRPMITVFAEGRTIEIVVESLKRAAKQALVALNDSRVTAIP